MAYTQSGIERRRNISEMAQALSGAKHRTAELKAGQREGRKNRFFGLLGKGIDFAGGMARQKLAGKQGMEQQGLVGQQGMERQGLVGQQGLAEIGARGEEARQTAREGRDDLFEIDKKIMEREAELKAAATDPTSEFYQQGTVEENMLLLSEVKKLSPADRELFFRLIKSGTITAEDGSETLDSQMLYQAWFLAYGQNAIRLGQEPNREGFRLWVENAIQPMAGFDSMTAIQAKSIMDAFPRFADLLFGPEGAEDGDKGRGFFSKTFSDTGARGERRLLDDIIRAQQVQMKTVRSAGAAAGIERKWKPIIDEINQEGTLDAERLREIRAMIRKILGPFEPVPSESELGLPY